MGAVAPRSVTERACGGTGTGTAAPRFPHVPTPDRRGHPGLCPPPTTAVTAAPGHQGTSSDDSIVFCHRDAPRPLTSPHRGSVPRSPYLCPDATPTPGYASRPAIRHPTPRHTVLRRRPLTRPWAPPSSSRRAAVAAAPRQRPRGRSDMAAPAERPARSIPSVLGRPAWPPPSAHSASGLGCSRLVDDYLGAMTPGGWPDRLQVRDDVRRCLFPLCLLRGEARAAGGIRGHPRRAASPSAPPCRGRFPGAAPGPAAAFRPEPCGKDAAGMAPSPRPPPPLPRRF